MRRPLSPGPQTVLNRLPTLAEVADLAAFRGLRSRRRDERRPDQSVAGLLQLYDLVVAATRKPAPT
jgi:hypothetical protein